MSLDNKETEEIKRRLTFLFSGVRVTAAKIERANQVIDERLRKISIERRALLVEVEQLTAAVDELEAVVGEIRTLRRLLTDSAEAMVA